MNEISKKEYLIKNLSFKTFKNKIFMFPMAWCKNNSEKKVIYFLYQNIRNQLSFEVFYNLSKNFENILSQDYIYKITLAQEINSPYNNII